MTTTEARVFGSGGPNGARVFWPAGLKELTPQARVEAIARGWWPDGDTGYIVTRDGRRLYRPASAKASR